MFVIDRCDCREVARQIQEIKKALAIWESMQTKREQEKVVRVLAKYICRGDKEYSRELLEDREWLEVMLSACDHCLYK
jgi:hypothetical protein